MLSITNGSKTCYIAFEQNGELVADACQITAESQEAHISIGIFGDK